MDTENKSKVRVYIDGANMLYTQKKLGWNIDWTKLVEYLKSQWNVEEIRYYTGVKEDDEKMKGFLKIMAIMIMETIITPIKKSNTPTSTLGFLSYIEQRPRKPR